MKSKLFILSLLTSALINLPVNSNELRYAKNKKMEIYPVKFSKNKKKNCLDYHGSCLLPLSRKPAAVIENFKYRTFFEKKPVITFFVDEKASKSLRKVTKKYLNNNLAIVVDGQVLHVPKVKSTSKGNSFELTFCNKDNFKTILNSLNNNPS